METAGCRSSAWREHPCGPGCGCESPPPLLYGSVISNGRKIGREPTGRVVFLPLRSGHNTRNGSPRHRPPHNSRARQRRSRRDQATGTHNVSPLLPHSLPSIFLPFSLSSAPRGCTAGPGDDRGERGGGAMEFMEPKDIDWTRVVSRYVRDETYEGIEAPHWADLTDPNAGRAAVDDEAWFCRPDCRHPKTAEDFLKLSPSPKGKFLRSVSAMLPFGERDVNATNLRLPRTFLTNSGGAAPTFTPAKPKIAPKKRFQEDSENQDPALATPPPRQAPFRPPLGAPRWNKNAKDAIKSSAEKRPGNAEKEALLNKHAPPRQLKSTLSARNLFSGKDILGQISDFYDELKRMVGGGGSQPVPYTQEESSSTPMKGKKAGLKVEAGKQRSPSVLKEVKATPPTPQRFPSPSQKPIKNVRAGGMSAAASPSPLKKPLKDKGFGTPSKDLESKKDAARQPFGVKDMNNTACDAEGSSSSMFWFLKPCTFLVE
ncbi:hypothetical protein HU200_003702 [Digitaria exilis]|uniref:Uncharacterized protein n=1 Tax=Digitaria exilis TaxID=1010633 RepID=A0A835FTQ9_9POAL|nr:hypothetical protein HU200_003702 [Digitaria exilis]